MLEQFWLPSIDYFKAVLQFNLISVIDIAIVAFVMYRIMLLIKGTRAVQLIKGLIVLIALTALSGLFNLDTANWLLRQAMTALVVALPIVFQPELRRALEKLGQGRFLSTTANRYEVVDQPAYIVEIGRATTLLAKNKMGALFVLERETGLEEHIDTGVRIDGLVSADLLVNIFVNKTPLHDGAVIIRGGRVAAAACFLPLSENPHLASYLGARHRAGIGITEHSDAIAVIVSEETGNVSLAVEGNLTRCQDEAGLVKELSSLMHKANSSLSALLLGR
ncbi:MAG: diadenylate cyclase CdaA [Pelotomaculum sp.]